MSEKGKAMIAQKEQEKIRRLLRKEGNKFLEVLKEEVDSCIILNDVDRLERLTSIIHIHMDSEVIRTLRKKGFDEEIRDLCDQAGKVKYYKGEKL